MQLLHVICLSAICQLAGEGERAGRHFRIKGHQEKARGGQSAGGAHPLGEEDPGGSSFTLRRQVSSVQPFKHASSFSPTCIPLVGRKPRRPFKFLLDPS